jgi:hypothetical protein
MADVKAIEPFYLTSMNSSLSLLFKTAKILVGVFLLAVGLVMLVLIALGLLPFPGGNKIELSILSRK